MKNIAFIIVISTFLFGCGKSGISPDDIATNVDSTTASITGIWKKNEDITQVSRGYIDPVFGTEFVDTSFSVVNFPHNDSAEEYLVLTYDSIHVNYYYIDDTLFMYHDFDYFVEGNNLYFIFEWWVYDPVGGGNYYADTTLEYTILSLTDSTLFLSYYDRFEVDVYGVGLDTTYFEEHSGTVSFTKSSGLPSIIAEPLNKKTLVNNYKSFFGRRAYYKERID